MKIFCLGLPRTGTKTLAKALYKLGVESHIYSDLDALHSYLNNDIEAVILRTLNFSFFKNWPWALMYKELHNAYPDAKFILTIRRNHEIWFNSLCRHADRTGPTDYRSLVFGYSMPHKYKKEHVNFYNKHNKDIIIYFKDTQNIFLRLCWESGDGWEKLCSFLNCSVPETDFPHENKST
jgi:hypothetical protein